MKNQTKLGIGIVVGAGAIGAIGATQNFRIDAAFAWCALGIVAATVVAVSVPRLRKMILAMLLFVTAQAKAFIVLGILIGAAVGLIGWGVAGILYEVRTALPPRLMPERIHSVSDGPRDIQPINPIILRECDEGPSPCDDDDRDADDGGDPDPMEPMWRKIGS